MSARKTPTLVALHGHEDAEVATRRWAELMRPGGWRLEVPVATGASWFDTTARGVDSESLERSRRVVTETVAQAVARSDGPVVVAGFSQGAAMALALGDLPGLVGVIGVCPFAAETDGLDLSAGPPALLLPAADDDVVPAFLGEDLAAAMSEAGRRTTAATVAGGHAVGSEAVTHARSWLEALSPAGMKISLGLPVDRVSTGRELVSGEAIGELAAAWEQFGFDAAFVTDHPAPDDRWLAAGGHHALEPTVALSIAAAATSRLALHTHVMVLAYRNPFLAAKAIASLDVVSGGRVILGVAAGYLRREFDALGVDFETRGELLDESIAVLRQVFSGESVSGEGSKWNARSVTALPRPLQQPGPPMWIGGNSRRAMRRAVTSGEGWSPFPTPGGLERATRTASIASTEDLRQRLDHLDGMCEELGRANRPTVCFSPFSMGDYLVAPQSGLEPLVREVRELGELGVDWLCLTVPGDTRPEVLELAGQLAEALELEPPDPVA